jgi:Arc/MetJ family transcription regulator
MKIAVTLDDNLLNEAIEITGINQKRQLLNEALSELIKLYKMRGLLSLENSDIWDGNVLESAIK